MSKAKLEAARELIREKRYDDARRLLEGIDHPTAREWIAKIDERQAPPAPPVKKASRTSGCLAILILGVLIWGIDAVNKQTQGTITDAARGAGEQLATAGLIAQAETPSLPTPLPQGARGENTALPTATLTVTPSATITETLLPSATPRPRGYVHRDDYGDDWPFTVDDGTLACEDGLYVVFRHGDVTYSLNGTAQGVADEMGYVDIDPIWRADPGGVMPKVYIGDMVRMGLELCDD